MTSVRGSVCCLVLVAAAFGVCGCGGAKEAKINGKVTLDGEELKDGLIYFIPKDTAAGKKVDVPFKEGKYEASVPPGSYRVEIRSTRVKGKKKAYDTPDSPLVDEVEERVPAKYNAQSTLTKDIDAKTTQVDFELKSK